MPAPRNTTSEKGLSRLSVSVKIGQALRRYFIAGLAALLPFLVTVGLVLWIDTWLRDKLMIRIPGLGLVVTFLLIISVGILTVHFFGRVLFRTLEVWFSRFPVIREIYSTVKQFAEFLFDKNTRQAFRRVVLVQYPRPGAYSIAFVTNESQTTVTGTSQKLLTLLIPNPPSPFTGPIIFVPAPDVVDLQLSIEDAVKLIVSGGVVAQPLQLASSNST